MKLLLKIFTVTTSLFFAAHAFAQIAGVGDGLSVTMEPEHPKARERVIITLENFSVDLNRADIRWILNNKVARQGKGATSFSFQTGPLGSTTGVSVVVNTAEGFPIERSFSFQPAEVSLIYEANSYTPPFYRGRAFFPFQGHARVVALPKFVDGAGKRIAPENLVYKWKEKGNVIGAASGYGRTTFFTQGSVPLRPTNVAVEVSSLDQNLAAVAAVDIAPTSPKILFYEDNPLYGILFNHALSGSVPLLGSEIKVVAVPYFFDVKKKNAPNLTYKWTVNFASATPGSNKSSLVLRKTGAEAGEASVSLQASHDDSIFQFASGDFSIQYGAGNTAAFGQ